MGILFFCCQKNLQSNLTDVVFGETYHKSNKKKCLEKKKIAETEREFIFFLKYKFNR